ncbi:hypothetical protein [Paenibacillus marinisediminis]
MSFISIIFLCISIILVGVIPYVLWRGLERGKKWIDIFTSTIILLLLFFISVGEVMRSFLNDAGMDLYIKFVLILFIFIGVIPLIVITIRNMKHSGQKWQDPATYKYVWLYKIRHTLLVLLVLVLLLGIYQLFYLIKYLY